MLALYNRKREMDWGRVVGTFRLRTGMKRCLKSKCFWVGEVEDSTPEKGQQSGKGVSK